MAFPAAPTESGAAKMHFLTTDGNAAAGWFGVTEGPTGTGANTVGFAAIATHVEGDAVAAPGGLNTTGTDVPVVLVAGDDGTNAVPLQLSGSDLKITLDSEAVVLGAGTAEIGKLAAGVAEIGNVKNAGTFAVQSTLQAGTAAFGKLAANSGVDIGDVDVISLVPGTGATNLGKAADAVAGATDTGVAPLAVRDDALSALTPAEGDYVPLRVNSTGALHVTGAGGGTEYNEDDVTPAPIIGTASLMERDDVLSTLTPVAGDFAALRCSAEGALWVQDFNSDAILAAVELIDNIVLAEDAAHSSGDTGVQMLAVRKATPADLSGTDGDYEPLQLDNGRLWVSATIDAALPAGTNAIGKLAANSGVDIGDVDVLSLPATPAGSNTIGEVTIGAATGAAGDLAKAEDAVHGSGDIGVMSLAVRNDALAALAGADGDYAPLQVSVLGGLFTVLAPETTGGYSRFYDPDLDEAAIAVKAGAGQIYAISAFNMTAGALFLQLYDVAQGSVTVGTTAPTEQYVIPANADLDGAGFVLNFPHGVPFGTAITVACTTNTEGNGAPGANACNIVIHYK